MALFTSYLGFFNRKDCSYVRWDSPDGLRYLHFERDSDGHKVDVAYEPFFVMVGRGNDEVAPSSFLLELWKKGEINWNEYRQRYIGQIYDGFGHGVRWMKKVGKKAWVHNVVLICYEKDSEHCHRTLLAENIVKWSNCEYKGELNEE